MRNRRPIGVSPTTATILVAVGIFAGACSTPEPPARPLANPSWVVQHQDSTARFIGSSVVDEMTVWVSGTGGRFGRTTDGGETWNVNIVPGADHLEFRDVHAFDSETAFLLSIGSGDQSRIYKTVNGGESWNISFRNENPNAFFDCLDFWDRERGFAFSDSDEGEFILMRTLDGGDSWSRIPPENVPDARDGEGAFASSGTCVLTRPGGLGWFSTGASSVDTRVFRTTDYGETWTASVTPVASTSGTSGLFSLTFLDDTTGAALGGDFGEPDSIYQNVAITHDGGLSWEAAGPSNLRGSVFGASYVPGTPTPTLVAVAPTGSDFSTDNGQTWTLFDSENYWSVDFHSVDAGWAVGPGKISRIVNSASVE